MGLYSKVIDLQKLNDAWKRVRRNKPAAGVDNVTHEDFDGRRQDELKRLAKELREHSNLSSFPPASHKNSVPSGTFFVYTHICIQKRHVCS